MEPILGAKARHLTANLLPWAFGLCLSACSGAGDESSSQTPVSVDADGLRTLVTADWELAPGDEQYVCAWVTVKEEMYLRGFRALSPPGTHHTALTVSEMALRPDGVAPCNVTTVGPRTIYGTGVGTEPFDSPPGIALKVSPGNQLILNLHIFNTSHETLRGTSGTKARLIDKAQVTMLSEGISAGPLELTVPPGRSTQMAKCTFDHDSTIFRVFPHMHQTGVHMKIVAHSSLAGSIVLHDGPYDFNEQLVHGVDLVPMKAGDVVDLACTYQNDTGGTLNFGESTRDEMCIAGIGRFPAGNGSSACTH
jgi:hypothetical protein